MEILAESGLKIFGRDFVDQQAVVKILAGQDGAFQTPLSPQELLLEQARKRGEVPIYRPNNIDGTPLTMHWMVESLRVLFEERSWGQILYAPSLEWCQDQAFYMEDTPRPGFALVSKEPIPGSTNQDYWKQTELLARLVGNVYQGREVPNLYQDALQEWGEERERLNRILISDWRGAAKGLTELQLNQHLGIKPVEGLFDTLMFFLATGKRRLEDIYTRTNAISSDGRLVDFGGFRPLGADVDGWRPGFGAPDVGVCSNLSIL